MIRRVASSLFSRAVRYIPYRSRTMHLRVYVEDLEDSGRKSIVGHVRRDGIRGQPQLDVVLQAQGAALVDGAAALLGLGLRAAAEVGDDAVRERLDEYRQLEEDRGGSPA